MSRGMGDSIVCLSSGEVVLFLFLVLMFTLFIIAMCCVTKRQCREDGLRIQHLESEVLTSECWVWRVLQSDTAGMRGGCR